MAHPGPLRNQSFIERGKERLLSRKFNSDLGFDDSFATNGLIHRMGERVGLWWCDLKGILVSAYNIGRSDPRKTEFAAKMGFALSLVSLLNFFKEPLSYIGQHSVWAVVTVVVVFEFSIGATSNKGFNRGMGTLSAGAIGLGIAELSVMAGKYKEVVIVLAFFISGFLASYLKSHQSMKQYEYSFRVFLMTISIVLASGNSSLMPIAISRSTLIAVGATVVLLVNICIFPIWAGEDLHKVVVKNFTGVASSLEDDEQGAMDPEE